MLLKKKFLTLATENKAGRFGFWFFCKKKEKPAVLGRTRWIITNDPVF